MPHFWHSNSFFQWLRLLNLSKQLVKGMCNESCLGDGTLEKFLRKAKWCIYLNFDRSACMSSVKETRIASFQIWRQSIVQQRWKLIAFSNCTRKTLHNHTWSQWQHSGVSKICRATKSSFQFNYIQRTRALRSACTCATPFGGVSVFVFSGKNTHKRRVSLKKRRYAKVGKWDMKISFRPTC